MPLGTGYFWSGHTCRRMIHNRGMIDGHQVSPAECQEQETGRMLLSCFCSLILFLPNLHFKSFFRRIDWQNGRIFCSLLFVLKDGKNGCYLRKRRFIADYIGCCIDGYFRRMYWSFRLRSSLSGRLCGCSFSGVMGGLMSNSCNIWPNFATVLHKFLQNSLPALEEKVGEGICSSPLLPKEIINSNCDYSVFSKNCIHC